MQVKDFVSTYLLEETISSDIIKSFEYEQVYLFKDYRLSEFKIYFLSFYRFPIFLKQQIVLK